MDIKINPRYTLAMFLGSSVVEHATVNRQVAGSNPARGAIHFHMLTQFRSFFQVVLLSFSLWGCSPVLDPATQCALSSIYVRSIPERSGDILRTSLQRLLSVHEVHPCYELEVDLEIAEHALEMGHDAKINLLHVMLKAPFKLHQEGKVVYAGQAVTYYYRTLTPSFYSQTTTQAYIGEEGAEQLAHSIVLELAHFFKEKNCTSKKSKKQVLR